MATRAPRQPSTERPTELQHSKKATLSEIYREREQPYRCENSIQGPPSLGVWPTPAPNTSRENQDENTREHSPSPFLAQAGHKQHHFICGATTTHLATL